MPLPSCASRNFSVREHHLACRQRIFSDRERPVAKVDFKPVAFRIVAHGQGSGGHFCGLARRARLGY